MQLIVIVFLIIVICGGLPTWPYSQNWGYAPSSIGGLLLLILLIMWLMGYRF